MGVSRAACLWSWLLLQSSRRNGRRRGCDCDLASGGARPAASLGHLCTTFCARLRLGDATAIYQARVNETEWEPDVGMASDGTAEAVWTHHATFENGQFGNAIWAKHFTPGSGWGGPSWVSDPELTSNGFPAIAVARNGTAVAVW